MINFLRKRRKPKAQLAAYALENNGQKVEPAAPSPSPGSLSARREGAVKRVQLMMAFGWSEGMSTMYGVSKYAGLGNSTVSRMMSGAKVRPLTLDAIYAAFEKFKQEVKPDVDKYLEAEEKTELQQQIEKPAPNDQPGQETISTEEFDLPPLLADSIDFSRNNTADLSVESQAEQPVESQAAPLDELTYANAFRIPPGSEVWEKPLRELTSISPLWVAKNDAGFHYLQGSFTPSDGGSKQYLVIMPNPQFMETDGFNHTYPPYMVFLHKF